MLIYTTGTINEPDAGSVGLSMAEKIRDDLTAHAAWVLEEEYTPGGGTIEWFVFRCLATESGLSADFFAVMARTIATGELRFCICEGYDISTHTMQFFPVGGNSTNVAFDASGRRTTTFVLASTAFSGNSGVPTYTKWTPSSTSTKWWLIADDSGFTVAFNGAANAFVHVGEYTFLGSGVNDLPIQFIGSDFSQGGITRNPALAGVASARDWGLYFQGGGSTNVPTGPLLGFQGDLKINDKLQSNLRPVAEQGMTIYQGVANQQSDTGWALGKQNRMRVGATPPTGFAFGDAYALDGTLWVPYLPTDPRVWDTGVAA
jgi:hypothetical protein